MNATPSSYTCRHYREEMMLLQLQHRLNQEDLSREEREVLEKAVADLRQEMGLD